MKKFFLFAAVALLAACSSDDLNEVQQSNPIAVADDGSVGFDAYVVRGLTRAGGINDINIDQLQSYNFGVFGYYTDNNDYDGTTLPNFFYNQQVNWNSGYWKYTPVKYWPNEYGDNAISDDNDRVTFFAYAPYVDFNASTGKIKTIENGNDQWGIVQASRNTNAGDPWVKYNVSFDGDKQVDLLWGVNKDYSSWSTVNGGTQTLAAGLPWLNVQRPLGHQAQDATTAPNQRVKFQFKHALAKLTATVDAVVDAEGGPTANLDSKTRIYVRSITFTGFATKGMLNLNNTEKDLPLWLEYNGNGDLEPGVETTIYDGRKDGKEGTAGTATNEKVLGLNPQLVQDENQLVDATLPATGKVWYTTNDDKRHVGVTETEQNLFRKWETSKYVAHQSDHDSDPDTPDQQGYIYVIPTGEEVQVTIVYDVETISENLPVYLADGKTAGSSIENKITKTVNFGNAGLEAGKAYTLKLHLGMNSVKIDAAVTAWDTDTPAQDIHLPNNKTEYAAGGTYTFSVPGANIAEQNFILTGFYGGESVLATAAVAAPITAATPDNSTAVAADATGKLNASVTCGTASKSTKNASKSITWKGQASNRTVTLNVIQLAQPLGLTASTPSVNDVDIVLDCTAGVDDAWTNVTAPTSDIKVIRNGVELPVVTSSLVAGKILFDSANHKLTLFGDEKVVSGDVFVITIKSGDAQAETITVKVS